MYSIFYIMIMIKCMVILVVAVKITAAGRSIE